MLRVVQVSLLGSIISNLLLVLGTAFFVGGIKFSEQKFNRVGAKTNSGLLMLIVMALAFPTILDATHEVFLVPYPLYRSHFDVRNAVKQQRSPFLAS